MFNKKRRAQAALILPAVLAGGVWLFLCLDMELLMFACGIAAVAMTDPKGLMPWKGGES